MTHDTTSPTGEPSSPRRAILSVCLAVGLLCLIILFLYLTIRIGRRGRSAPPPSHASEIYDYSVDELSELAAYLSADLDKGRLRVAPPVEWYVAPRDKDYLVRFVFDRLQQNPFPRITIEARDADFQELREVTRANLPEFLQRFTDAVDERTRRATAGRILMLMLGDVPCLSYTVRMTFAVGASEIPAEREVLATLRNGRLYTVTLDVNAGKIPSYNGDAYAVVAGLQFLQPALSADEQTPPDATPKKTDVGSGTTASGTTDAGKAGSARDAR